MSLTLFQWINLIGGLVLLLLIIRLGWNMWISSSEYPQEWIQARKQHKISRKLLVKSRLYPDKLRFFSWWLQVERLRREKVPGAFAELGVYKGSSALAISLMEPNRAFHLFDTFEGFSKHDLEYERGEAATYSTRDFADTHVDMVKRKFRGNPHIFLHKGLFSETKHEVEKEQFALVNLDADLYRPTKEALEFFYPRLSKGGVLFIHDYNGKWQGIQRAVDEFVKKIPENMILLPDANSTVIIEKSKI